MLGPQDEEGQVTDMISFYTLPSTVMHHPVHKQLKAAYSFYNVCHKTPLIDLMQDALILAKQVSKLQTGCYLLGGAVASWLVRSTPERAVRVRALAGDIVSYSYARHFTVTVPLSTQVYKWVLANVMLGVNPVMD